MILLHTVSLLLLSFATALHAFNHDLRINSRARTPYDLRRRAIEVEAIEKEAEKDGSPFGYPNQYIQLPVDHFHNDSQYAPHSNATFSNRYWFTDRYYKPGGPVMLLLVGESNGAFRLPILHTGITHQLIKENNALGVVMEHRYYGKSFPTPDLSTKNLRFLTTDQALADVAYLAQNVQFAGLEQYNLTSDSVPWIVYGGSYSGAMTAFLRVLYPDVFWGAISSSGVTEAIYDYWQYYQPVAEYGPPACIAAQQVLTNVVDNIHKKNSSALNNQLKAAFGLPNVTHFSDFANQISYGIGNWQSLVWDPKISYDGFYWYCGNITSGSLLFPKIESKRSEAEKLITAGGYTPNTTIVNQMLNYIGWNAETYVTPCAEEGATQDECFSNLNSTFYQQDGVEQYDWRSWDYQICTQWGFFQTGSGVPADQLPLISRAITLEYETVACREAFGITSPSKVELINRYGGYNIAYPRLALIGGEWDPWRPVTPLAFEQGAAHRESTTEEPFLLIPRAVHHWDEYGVKDKYVTKSFPPRTIKRVQAKEHEFVKAWLDEWKSGSTNWAVKT